MAHGLIHGTPPNTVGPIFCHNTALSQMDMKHLDKLKPTHRLKAINHSGEDVTRNILPIYTYFGTTDRHPEPQFFVRVYDFEKKDMRDFACKGIYSWESINV